MTTENGQESFPSVRQAEKEAFVADLRAGFTQPDLAQVAAEKGLNYSEARAMTRAELIRWLDEQDPRD